VNFITAHDGFCLKDLVSYNVKHNQVNGESNRDGTNNNYSFNFGVEGETTEPTIGADRRKAARNLLATLLFSAGIPMVTAGDERGKTQRGNNNAYCQDSNLSWVNWDLSRTQQGVEATFSYLTKLRRENPALRPNNFGSYEQMDVNLDRIRWFNKSGGVMTEEDWNHSETRQLLRFTQHLAADGTTNQLLLIINGEEKEMPIQLPQETEVAEYEMLWNSAHELPPTELNKVPGNKALIVSGASMVLLRAI
jgi:glycogen operon protein